MASYLDVVRERVLIYDGAAGVNLMQLGLGVDDFGGPALEGCWDILVDTRPDVVADLHDSFFAVGVDAVETNSFGAFAIPLAEYGIGHRAFELSEKSARIAREVADGHAADGRPRFVAGSIGPGTKFASLGQISFAELRDAYDEQARGLLRGGVDLFLIETQFDLLGAKAAVIGCRKAMAAEGRRVPIQVQVTIELTGTMLPGTEIGAALVAIAALGVDAVGLNCATGPAEMGEHLRHLTNHSPVPISCLPNAGLPSVVDGHMHYDLTPQQLADYHTRFITEMGVRIVGGCCGTTPEHLKAVVDACRDLTPATTGKRLEPSLASLYSPVSYDQSPSVLMVGERTNANGSKKFREAMLEADWDTCVAMAGEQVREGSHVIDVCVDYVGRDGSDDMAEVASRFATQCTVPLMIDSTEPAVVETALQWLGGKAILNSVNLEDGPDAPRLVRFLEMARDYGAALVATCIDERGQARDRQWKLDAARAIVDLAGTYGIPATDIFIDPLALTLGTGIEESRGDGLETIEGIRLIKAELPGVRTILGLSNISFGLKPAARHALNSVYLHECQQAGLDAAIVHAARIMPLAKMPAEHVEVCLDLIYDRRTADYDPLAKLLELFEGVSAATQEVEDRSGWPIEQRLHRRIVDGDRNGLAADLDEAMAAGTAPLDIVNDVLLGGMKEVGELFGSGQMQLPFVLQSAETMKAAVAHLEPHMDTSAAGGGKGRLVLATVKGDVHDIGKNLVDIILTNNGYEVHNLGIKVSIAEMIEKAVEVKADAIGMSGLLVKSTLIMRENLEELNARGLADVPVILGGAALTRSYVERDLREVYDGRLFYGKDAFEGLHTMDKLVAGDDLGDWGKVPEGRVRAARSSTAVVDRSTLPARSPEAVADNPLFAPPFIGSRVVKGIALDEIAGWINETSLFRHQWGYRPEHGETDDEFKTRVRAVLRQELARAKTAGALVPQVVYGYFWANADGDDLVIWKDESRTAEWLRFSLPRQTEAPHLCIADFFRSVDSGDTDVAAFHLVTMGERATEHALSLKEADQYTAYLHQHGLGVDMAEALAELWHHRIRQEWGFADEDGPTLTGLFKQQYRGGRYSFGYPACPLLEDNAKVAELLEADRIGVSISEETSWQYHPEQTTSALICHHPRAKYFIAR